MGTLKNLMKKKDAPEASKAGTTAAVKDLINASMNKGKVKSLKVKVKFGKDTKK